VIEAAHDMGITSKLGADPSIALGTSEVTLLELTSAYAAFAANAYPIKPWGVVSTGENGKTKSLPPKGAGKWQLPEAATMRELMQATVQYGTGQGARLGYPSFGKTGTSQNYRDAWFIGFAGNLVVGVWVGNDDNSPMARVTGGNLPTMIWAQFMNKAAKKDPNFSTHLPQQIAGFEARNNPARSQYAMHGDLQSLLVSERYADSGGAYYGYGRPPMAVGYGYEDRRFRSRFRQRQYEREEYDRRGNERYSDRREDSRRVFRRVFGGGW
jgi:penicillin-binding protein 1A